MNSLRTIRRFRASVVGESSRTPELDEPPDIDPEIDWGGEVKESLGTGLQWLGGEP